jgi:hypothetical protein
MMKVACHCTAVRFRIAEPPPWVLDCNCTLCRRYGALWAYYHGPDQAKLLTQPDPGLTDVYAWQDEEIFIHRCKGCGCVTHLEAAASGIVFGVNMRMAVPALDPAKVPLRQVDNGHTGFFWTRSATPVIASNHPLEPPPGPDDWR